MASPNRICNSMVNNPVYDGPVYESVQPKFETLVAETSHSGATSNILSIAGDFSTGHEDVYQQPNPFQSKKNRYIDWSSIQVVDTQINVILYQC